MYEPYGNPSATGETNTNTAQYTGRENDGTGLYYYRARYYQPRVGRFVSEDPIGLNGGSNLYAYVGGNPINLIDPTGEFGIPGAIAGGIIGGISGGLGAAATGGIVWRGALFGVATGAVVGGTGAWIGASLKLTRFNGHLFFLKRRCRHGQASEAVPGGVPGADGRAGEGRTYA
ncbi:RHS repeat-associated core domain-containing protein [Burkholderia sp. NFPP32]|uniref:RHS repeat-associated core domain-containing protein n=2 Tax=unclassified Burkholderia TaxID=2613784 RepID=UPI002108C515|nr:RHS repeat-associated core domain-containing protein [Burkholderia sp. NFPP32]